MIYAGSTALDGLRYVVLDEVHYLQDAYRGPVWEEVILHLPPHVRLVCLSATVSNAEELADWITTVRGPTTAVIEERRPVELVNLYCVGDRSSPGPAPAADARRRRAQPGGDAARCRVVARSAAVRGRPRRRFFTPRRVEVVERLADDELLPGDLLHLQPRRVRRRRRRVRRRRTAPDHRRRARAHPRDRRRARRGAVRRRPRRARLRPLARRPRAGHRRPPRRAWCRRSRRRSRRASRQGLVKVVFATETLALGINMPARTVVIEKLSKFTGERHEFLTPGEYTQLTGRAGRRGIDPVGYAVVLWSPFVPFEQVASLASSRAFRLTSAFRPTYNMAANLVRALRAGGGAPPAQPVVRAVPGRPGRGAARGAAREAAQCVCAALEHEATCERGDVEEYRRLARRRRRGSPPACSRRGARSRRRCRR